MPRGCWLVVQRLRVLSLYPSNLQRNGLSSLCVSARCPEVPRGSAANGLLLLSAPLPPPPPPLPPSVSHLHHLLLFLLHPFAPSLPVITSRLLLNPIILLSWHALLLAANSADDAAVHHAHTHTNTETHTHTLTILSAHTHTHTHTHTHAQTVLLSSISANNQRWRSSKGHVHALKVNKGVKCCTCATVVSGCSRPVLLVFVYFRVSWRSLASAVTLWFTVPLRWLRLFLCVVLHVAATCLPANASVFADTPHDTEGPAPS